MKAFATADAFGRHIELVARHLLGPPNASLSTAVNLRWGTNGSFSVDVIKGVWYDNEAGVGGGCIDLVTYKIGLKGKGAADFLADIGCPISDDRPGPAKKAAHKPNGAGAPEIPPASKNEPAPAAAKVVAARFEYVDEHGAPAFTVERVHFQKSDGSFELTQKGRPRKTFRQYRPDPDDPRVKVWSLHVGEFMRSNPGDDWRRFDPAKWEKLPSTREKKTISTPAPVVPYRLPEVIETAAQGGRVFVVEGEGKAELLRSWGCVATCCAEGAGKWSAEHASWLQDADVVILPDSDTPGRRHAAIVADSLKGIAERIRIIELPGLPERGDIVDWSAADHTREELDKLIEQTSVRQPKPAPPSVADAVLTLDPADPFTIAKRMVERLFVDHESRRVLQRHRGTWWKFHGNHYRESSDEEMRAQIWKFLAGQRKLSSKNLQPEPFSPDFGNVSNVSHATIAVTLVDGSLNPPAWMNGAQDRLDARELIAVQNGLLHLPTGALYKPTPDFFCTSASPVVFDPGAPKPELWLKTLDQIFPGDDESIGTLQEVFGYILSPDTSQQKIFLWLGPPRSGKGTIARILRALIGPENVAGPTLSQFATNFGLAPLIGKPLAVISDARVGRDTSATIERLLSISGEDALTIDRKYLEPWTGKLPTRLLILTNEQPRLPDTSTALVKRFIVLAFPVSFYGNENPNLTDQLMSELPGIMNWAREGFLRLKARGRFIQPQSAAQTIEEMAKLASPVTEFVEEQCDLGDDLFIDIDALYQAWRQWCSNTGRNHPGASNTFSQKLHDAFPRVVTVRPRIGKNRNRVFAGIDIKAKFKPTRAGPSDPDPPTQTQFNSWD